MGVKGADTKRKAAMGAAFVLLRRYLAVIMIVVGIGVIVPPAPVGFLIILIQLAEIALRLAMGFNHPLVVIDAFMVVPSVVVAVVSVVASVIVVISKSTGGTR